jgi:hypothetical protein
MLREYRLIWWSDRTGELSAASFLIVAMMAGFHLTLFHWLSFTAWLSFCIWLQRFTKRRYWRHSLNQDPPTSRSMYRSIFIDHYPERWHAATKAAGGYQGKTVSECDPKFFRNY